MKFWKWIPLAIKIASLGKEGAEVIIKLVKALSRKSPGGMKVTQKERDELRDELDDLFTII
jgi:hypothetical protein